jgi:hypothetical protein
VSGDVPSRPGSGIRRCIASPEERYVQYTTLRTSRRFAARAREFGSVPGYQLFDAGYIKTGFHRRNAGLDLMLRQLAEQRSRRQHHAAPAVGECRLARELLRERDSKHRREFDLLEDETIAVGRRHHFEGGEIMNAAVDVYAT